MRQSGCGRGEDELPAHFGVVQRLHAEPIAHEVQREGGIVPQGEGEHAAQAGKEAVDPPSVVAMQQDLGVALTPEGVAEPLEVPADDFEVKDGTVKHDADAPVVSEHRLPPGGAQVVDAESSVAEYSLSEFVQTFTVRAAALESTGHGGDNV